MSELQGNIGRLIVASPFDAIREVDASGIESWRARELMKLLDYSRWQKFQDVIERAIISCDNGGHSPEDHFTRAGNMVGIGSGASREASDWILSRYACYLVAMNGDPRKKPIADAQSYFAIRARQAELASPAPVAGDCSPELLRWSHRLDVSIERHHSFVCSNCPDGFTIVTAWLSHSYTMLGEG